MAARRMFWTGPAMIAVMLLAFAVRIWRLEIQSLWYDEGVTAEIARRGLAELTRWTASDIQPPLYYYVVAGWGRVAGWSEFSLRFPSVVFGVLAVPLMAALTLRLTHRHGSALLAALFTAVHPLLVYYGQEARMYTLLVTLGILAGYCLVRLADRAGRGWLLWAGYVSVAAAAIYTHYFAFFLLLGLGLAYSVDAFWRWKKRPTAESGDAPSPWSPVLRLLAANGLVLLLYLPWITAMITRLRVDRSYWTGTLKLHEALLHVAVSFTSGETVAERLAVWLLAVYALVTFWAIVQLWRSGAPGRRVLLYGGLWLVAPVAAVLALSMNLPKFNARYVMVALPGLILLWSGGLGGCGQSQAQVESRRVFSTGRFSRQSAYLPVVASMLLVAGFAFADANWFLNAAFTKDEWREAAVFLRERIHADERIVLVSGHAWPVWNYYAPDMPVVRLPPIEVLDVDAVLGFEDTGPALKMAFDESTDRKGAWLVNWQDEVVDPNDVVPVQLELGGREKGQSMSFYGLTLRRFSGQNPGRFAAAPPIDHELNVAMGSKVILRGYKVLNNGDLLLFWQRPAEAVGAQDDLHFSLQSYALDGTPLADPVDRRLAGYNYPTPRWAEHEVVMGRVPAELWLGSAPQQGMVRFTLRVYDGNDPAAKPLNTQDGSDTLDIAPVEVIID